MTLIKFVENLKQLMEDRPETATFEVVTSEDEEGNGYSLVYFEPTVGNYNKKDKEFQAELELNAVCVN